MSIEAYNYATRLKVGNLTAKFVLGRLADRADERFSCHPSIGLLAAEAEKSERTVQRAIEFLIELRLMSDKPAFRSDGSQTSNRYFLHGPWDQYAGTGVPFEEIVTPKEARSSMWAQAPKEAAFRDGTAAAAALAADADALKASQDAAKAAHARAAAAKESQRARGRKAAAAKPHGEKGGSDEAQAGDVSAAQDGVTSMSPSPPTSMSPPGASPTSPLEPSVATLSSDDAPSGRSPAGCRQAPTGSRGLGKGGDAAPATSKPRLSKQERDQVQAVRALLPRELDAALGDRLPPNVSAAVVDALATGQPRERTAQQLVEHRVLPRWNGYWAEQLLPAWKAQTDAGRTPRAPYGPLLRMLEDTPECGSLACDDRTDVHTQQPCGACAMRAEDRRAARKADREHDAPHEEPGETETPTLPTQRARVVIDDSAGRKPECEGQDGLCGRPAVAGSHLCQACLEPVGAPF